MYLDTKDKVECLGCEACTQVCAVHAINMIEDCEGFRYPVINEEKCVNCGRCRKVCPYVRQPSKYTGNKYVFGGYHKDLNVQFNSTSGGAFSAIVDAFCNENYVIFGAESDGLGVFHSYIEDKSKLGKFRKSKYSQSLIGNSYRNVKKFIKEGKKVLFSGTPCQVSGLLSFLGNVDLSNLLTVEVICEGVPSPLYIRKMEKYLEKEFGEKIESIDYRYTGKGLFSKGMWDFQKMKIKMNGGHIIVKDRWFNPFWSIWLQHLMSRPSCYKCPFATPERVADITLGDLWGVHLYCPELYGNNVGSSLVICNTEKGKDVFEKASNNMYGHELKFEEALKYQGPLRKTIAENENREMFIKDLMSDIDFMILNKKWANAPTIKLLFQKYIWGNRQKVFFWNIFHK